MDIFDEELLNFWKHLNECQVNYIMVGGVATNLNGYQRTTDDIDIWIEDTEMNRENLRKAFREAGLGDYYLLKTLQIVPGWTDFHLNNGLRVDLLIDMKGLEGYTFGECLQLASLAEIEGLKIPFLHINHLIANKKAVNRPKDQTDVIYLEKIKKYLEEKGRE
ncbi:nucleotidyltransferase [Terrimonas pollutisoli]|uniref:nucleotidyltransferase n=1 Tax=Terrimonas pollutisoli TaxID=3034147 RepID=UPI0023ECE04C|nr:nucleotidyltransferase [Terrimonas sp. H1YJ31]